MGVYLREFATQADYEAAESGLILPNVSLIANNNTVHYNPSSPVPPTPSHDYVEIGGLKWATMNIGAESVTDYGQYFSWGDIQGYTAEQVGSGEGKKAFNWDDYKYGNGTSNPGATGMSKYNAADGKTVLESSDDAVTAAWGDEWRMPTKDEFVTLGAAVNTAWTNDYQGSGVSGLVCTDKTDSSKVLFFPVAGYCNNGRTYLVGGYYWSSSLYSNVLFSNGLAIYSSSSVNFGGYNYRCYGLSIRGVMNE
jgi:hypothetical protein